MNETDKMIIMSKLKRNFYKMTKIRMIIYTEE